MIRSDRGASAVLVGLLMVPILAFAGLAIDVGGMYWENGQLQNGADASALAVAQSCAASSGCLPPRASQLANSNANDSLADATVSYPGSGLVQVRTSTRTANGVFIDHQLWDAVQGLLGLPKSFTTEYTEATAEWGTPGSGAGLPLTVSACDFAPALDGTKQLIAYNNNGRACAKGAGYPPGGFGWIDGPTCVAPITNGTAQGVPGNSYPGACDSTFTASLVGQTVLVPIFGAESGTGNNVTYRVSGIAAFVITGWRFSGGSGYPQVHTDPTLAGTANDCTSSCRGIQGYFTHYASLNAVGTPIGTPGTCTYGVCTVALVK